MGLGVMALLFPVPSWFSALMVHSSNKRMQAVWPSSLRHTVSWCSTFSRLMLAYTLSLNVSWPTACGIYDLRHHIALGVLRMIKLFALEGKIAEDLRIKRETELRWIVRSKMLQLLNNVVKYVQFFLPVHTTDPDFIISHTIPLAHMVVTFAVFVCPL